MYLKNILLKFRACRFGKRKIVYILLEKGALVNEKNVAGSTPLHLACEYGDADIVSVITVLLMIQYENSSGLYLCFQ